MIGAIETEYAGYRFRSRLEARWAVFFDACGIKWQYEAQGYEGGGFRYLPDFYLPEQNVFCEVKGSSVALQADARRMAAVLCSGAVPGFVGGVERAQANEPPVSEMVILGDVPEPPRRGVHLHPVLRHSGQRGLIRTYGLWLPATEPEPGKDGTTLLIERGWLVAALMGLHVIDGFEQPEQVENWTTDACNVPCAFSNLKLNKAYEAARQARFEFGAKGAL